MSATLKISVVIPTHNRAKLLAQTLDSLANQTLEPSAYEVIVVDDGSTDNTREVCQNAATKLNLKYAPQENSGISVAKNRGIREGGGDLILFFDDDDVADENLLSQHVLAHREHPETTVAVLGYTDWHPSVEADCLMQWMVGKGGFLFGYDGMEHGRLYDYTYFWGGRSSCKRRFLEEYGVFNPKCLGSEDIELGYRLSRHGLQVVYNKNARSSMVRPVDFDTFLARCQRQGTTQVWFSQMHAAPEVQKWCMIPEAEGIWDYLKIKFADNVRRARQLTEQTTALRRQIKRGDADADAGSRLEELTTQVRNLYWRVFTAAKYKGIVEELQRQRQTAVPTVAQPQHASGTATRTDNRKRILVIDLFVPVFNRASGCLRAFQLLKMFRELNYDVTFLSKFPQYADEYAPHLEQMGVEVIAGDPLGLEAAYQFAACPLVDYDALLSARHWDLVVVACWDNAEYYLPILRKHLPRTPIVVDTVDITFLRKTREAELGADPRAISEALANKKREIAAYRQADRLWVVTDADRMAVEPYVPGIPIDVVSNIHVPVSEKKEYAATKDLLFVGNFWHLPNVDAVRVFCEYVAPLLRENGRDLQLHIAGDNVPESIRRFESKSIRFLGHVPDLTPLLRSARISIAPLRYGAGMKGKIGEALSWGLPVVTTKMGAEGMDLVHETHAMIADTPAAFAEAILRLYDDETLWTKLSQNGKAKVESAWGYDVVKHKVTAALDTAIGSWPAVSVVILVHNELAHTKRCLESIQRHTPEPHELILVDNGSTDETPAFLKQWQAAHPNCTVIRNATNRGFAVGNNQGLAAARGEFCVLLNNDTVVPDGWLARLQAVFHGHPDVGLVGPMSNYVSGPQLAPDVTYKSLNDMDAFAARRASEHNGQSVEVDRLVGFCLMLRRAVIEKIGGLDEAYGSGNFEDDDLCIRAQLAGFKARIAQDAFVHHTGNQTFKGAGIDYRQSGLRNWDLFRAKWRLPSEASLERGYPTPDRIPDGVALKVSLRPLASTHNGDGARRWTEENPTPPRSKTNVEVPPVARLGALDGAHDLFDRRDLAAAWNAVLAALKVRPSHPEAHLLLARIALAVGDGVTARRCAQRARDLAPGWKAVKQFLKKPLPGNTHPDWLILPARADDRLTVCVIAKNEEQFLAQCLQSVRGIADQIIVVDTGSTDRTVEIAREHGAEVYSFPWCDDFSAARNAALEHATGDWILSLDADEEMPVAQHEALRADMKKAGAIAYRLPLTNCGREIEGQSFLPRLFRNVPGAYYFGRIHEQVFPTLVKYCNAWGLGIRLGTAQLLHHGYAKDVVQDRKKIERNLRMLRQAVPEHPNDPNLVMNLGLELMRSGDLSAGLENYREAFRLMSAQPPGDVSPELREALLTQFTCLLYKVRDYKEIVRVLHTPVTKNGGLTASLHFALGLAYHELKQYGEAAEQMRQCLAKRHQPALTPINTDILNSAPHRCLAMCLAQTGAAVEALKVLHQAVTENAADEVAWAMGGSLALQHPDFLEFACDWTREAIQYVPNHAEVVGQRAEALLLSGKPDEALPLWRQVNNREDARRDAAEILCAILVGESPSSPQAGSEPGVSQEFLKWYRRLLNWGERPTLLRLNESVGVLRTTLPGAAAALEAAFAEAAQARP